MIEICNLNKKYGRQQVLDNINLVMDRGESIAFIGPNGCGKTTLMKCILGLVKPESGKIQVNGNDIANDSQYRNSIGFMPQNSSFPPNMTVGEIFNTILDIRDHRNDVDKELYDAFDIQAISHKKSSELSGGMSQKVNAALAFLFNPDILVLDEPTASLDPSSSEQLKHKIRQESDNGKLICITSHILSELDGMINRIVFMEDGKMIFDRQTSDIIAEIGKGSFSEIILKELSLQHTTKV